MLLIKTKFNMFIVDHFSSCYINFVVSRRYNFLQGTQNIMHYGLQAQNILRPFSIVKLLEFVQNLSVAYTFHYVWSSLEITCIAFIVLFFFLENLNYFMYYFYFVYKLKYLLPQICLNTWQQTNVRKVE